jgi:hypothetical protein
MMIVFGGCNGTAIAVLMTDSLRRACPTRFSGSDLSRRSHPPEGTARQHPSLAVNFGLARRRCKKFLRSADIGPVLEGRV